MRVMIADERTGTRNRLAAAVEQMRAVSLGACVSNLSEAYHIAESRPPQAVIVAEALARLAEFEVLLMLFKALGIRCVVVSETAAGMARLPPSLIREGVAVTHSEASVEDLRQCLLRVHLGRTAHNASRRQSDSAMSFQHGRLILLGASTGGVDALVKVLEAFPPNCPPTLIVQHTSESFSSGLARLLDRNTAATVEEAQDQEPLVPGRVLLAPGKTHHLEVGVTGALRCRLREGPLQAGHRPSVDALFMSAVPVASRVCAAILTGMGRDGAEGMLALHRAGAHTIGQDEKTSLVYGMPRAAYELGGVRDRLPLDSIGRAVLENCSRRSAA
ncbi:CheB methylesterase domain-containing protein [Rhodovulum sulfidophilum]|uniref:CheB methylesterase domain-containing protein n=1 Tax=Rhodovulum sulfidophilum TaxID=35806 RepID=UPI0019239063|nr:CheB methylesterase domain-containing protein [Rhodovulum sulfidophilum]MBL3561835.1 chemotaxis protein CheB [Rhodovulum sulfidophilum]